MPAKFPAFSHARRLPASQFGSWNWLEAKVAKSRAFLTSSPHPIGVPTQDLLDILREWPKVRMQVALVLLNVAPTIEQHEAVFRSVFSLELHAPQVGISGRSSILCGRPQWLIEEFPEPLHVVDQHFHSAVHVRRP